jgi:hypothetical protein
MSGRTNPLARAMVDETKYTYGDNGAVELKTSGHYRLDYFTNLLKDTDADFVKSAVRTMVGDIQNSDNKAQYIHDIFILAFHKRATTKSSEQIQISDGEGCKNIYYEYILELYNYYPETIISIFRSGQPFVYGYWKDALNIWEKINKIEMDVKYKYDKYNNLIMALRYAMLTQRKEDLDEIDNKCHRNMKGTTSDEFREYIKQNKMNINVSNVGKFCVREGTHFDKTAYWYVMVNQDYNRETHVNYMIRVGLKQRVTGGGVRNYPSNKNIPFGAKKVWRVDNARLNIVLDVAETHFAGNTWSEIKIGHIPSLCFKRNTKGLINEKLKENVVDGTVFETTGNRYPENEDRVQCRKNMEDHIIGSNKINSSQIYPHNIISGTNPSSLEKKAMMAQWRSLLELTHANMEKVKEQIIGESTDVERAISSGNIIGCCDTSASMTWVGTYPERPYDIAVALTAFISELSNESWRDIAMSFSTTPSILNFENMNVFERVEHLSRNSGGSTNYMALHKELLRLCILRSISQEDLPVLLVLSDGHFDQQCSLYDGYNYYYGHTPTPTSGSTTHDNIIKLWTDAGYDYPPTVVYWNLAADKSSVQASSSMPGVQLLSGASPSNFKYILYGELAETVTTEVEIDGEKVEVKTKVIDPWSTFRIAMEQPYFESIREILVDSKEKYLELYN